MKAPQKELLIHLMLRTEVTLSDLIIMCNKNESEVIKLIREINELLEKDVIISDQQIFYMNEKAKVYCYKRKFKGKERLFSYLDANRRYSLIIIELLVSNDYPSLQNLANICLVSKNTILNDFKVIKRDLEEKGLTVIYSRKDGYSILGQEFALRNALVNEIKRFLRSAAGRILLEEKKLIIESEIFLMRKRLENVEERIGIKLTDEQLEELPYILQLLIKRANKMNDKWSFKVERYDIKNTKEYPKIKSMFWDYPKLTETDLLYLSLQVLASNMVESALYISDSDDIFIATDEFISNIESYLAIRITRRSELREKVILHMRPAIYRNLLGFQINNPLTEEFINEYREIYHVVLKSVEPFEKIIQHELSKQEVVYLSMIILAWIYQMEETDTVFKAVVLCQNGTAISKLLRVTLQSMFPEIDFHGAYSVRQFEQKDIDVDFIFTTVPYKGSSTTIFIPPILDKKSREVLKNRVNTEVKKNKYKMTSRLISSIRKYIPQENIKKVEEILDRFFKSENIMEPVYKDEEHFVFLKENISIADGFIKWEDVVDFSMQPLLKRNSITQNYITHTKAVFYENYEQMIIAPEIYLPHASPEHGALKMDYQVLILRNPISVPSGGKSKIIIALSPSIDYKHVPTLIKLNNLLQESEVFEQIYKASSLLDIKSLLNKK